MATRLRNKLYRKPKTVKDALMLKMHEAEVDTVAGALITFRVLGQHPILDMDALGVVDIRLLGEPCFAALGKGYWDAGPLVRVPSHGCYPGCEELEE